MGAELKEGDIIEGGNVYEVGGLEQAVVHFERAHAKWKSDQITRRFSADKYREMGRARFTTVAILFHLKVQFGHLFEWRAWLECVGVNAHVFAHTRASGCKDATCQFQQFSSVRDFSRVKARTPDSIELVFELRRRARERHIDVLVTQCDAQLLAVEALDKEMTKWSLGVHDLQRAVAEQAQKPRSLDAALHSIEGLKCFCCDGKLTVPTLGEAASLSFVPCCEQCIPALTELAKSVKALN